ncbi:C6 transcription factor [Pseudohyphozyma bogoriensis]|nr:C6 transcription factor [Pseudohyphozyma bogoriensis]
MTSITQLLLEIQPNDPELGSVDSAYGHERMGDGSIRMTTEPDVMDGSEEKTVAVSSELILELVNHFSTTVLPIFPILNASDFPEFDKASSVGIMASAAIAACSRKYTYDTFASVRALFHNALRSSDVLTVSSLANLQIHGATNSGSGSLMYLRTGQAIRMAQDLGLHRRPPSRLPEQEKEARMRAWLCCVVLDRWISLSFGQPMVINPEDCWDYFSDDDGLDVGPYLTLMFQLSEFVARTLRALYRPSLANTTDDQLRTLVKDIDRWAADLPEDFQFCGSETNVPGGFLHMMLIAIESLLLRPLMKPDARRPSTITFKPSNARWYSAVTRSQQYIDWMVNHGGVLMDWGFTSAEFSMLSEVSAEPSAAGQADELGGASLPDWMQTEWQGWCEGVMDQWSWDGVSQPLDDLSFPGLTSFEGSSF